MNNKSMLFFVSLLGLALLLVVTYQIQKDPFKNISVQQNQHEQAQSDTPHQMDAVIRLFVDNCARCHGNFGGGKDENPALIGTKLTHEQIAQLIRNGKGEMPAFNKLTDEQVHQLVMLVEKL